jgi:predicted phosphodiesterase
VSGATAILGDVHGFVRNLEQALAFCERRGVDRIRFLGDAVGYGRHPNETVRLLAARPDLVGIAGNHDRMAIGRYSRLACSTRGRCSTRLTRRRLADDARDYLARLPDAHRDGDTLFVHASVFRIDDYLLGERDVARNLAGLEANPPRLVFHGHTHRAALWEADAGGRVARGGTEGETTLRPDRTYFINPGAVGDLRDGATSFSFVVLDGDRLEWIRMDSTDDYFPELARRRRVHRHPVVKWCDRWRVRVFKRLFKTTGHGAVRLPSAAS